MAAPPKVTSKVCPVRTEETNLALPHSWIVQRNTGLTVSAWCSRCRHQWDGDHDELFKLMLMLDREVLFEPEVEDAVWALVKGEKHPLIERLRAERHFEEDGEHEPETLHLASCKDEPFRNRCGVCIRHI